MYTQKIEGEYEDSRIGLLHTIFEREDKVVDESVKSQLGEFRSEIEVNVADYRNPYTDRLDPLERLRHILEQGMGDWFSVETIQNLGNLRFQIGLPEPEHRSIAVQVGRAVSLGPRLDHGSQLACNMKSMDDVDNLGFVDVPADAGQCSAHPPGIFRVPDQRPTPVEQDSTDRHPPILP
jgi:hypothetical protein